MKSIDIKSLLIGALFTAVVFLSTGWQRGGIAVGNSAISPLHISLGSVSLLDGGSKVNPIYIKEVN